MSKILGFTLLLSGAAICGCSGAEGGADQVDVYPVSGKVTLNGAPVANAFVSFSPKGQMPAATAPTNGQGEYKLTTYDFEDGAAAGEYVVLVSKSTANTSNAPPVHDPKNPYKPSSHSGSSRQTVTSALPSKYASRDTSDLTATVKAEGENKINLELKP